MPEFLPLPRILAIFRPVCPSQWSTLQSGPLALPFSPVSSLFPAFSPQLVVHSLKWATGSHLFQTFDPVSDPSQGASGPLSRVGHWIAPFPGFWTCFGSFTGSQWSTPQSGPLAHTFFGLLTQFRPLPRELVVHSSKWTTGSRLFQAFDLVSASSRGASGPLARVDHWLTAFPGF